MVIERIEVRNFQSLRAVDLDLGRLTVVRGPSSSGKTALLRALRAVASNLRGAAHITRGAKHAAVTVRTGEHIITLERSPEAGLYRLVTVATGAEQVFSKLAGAVPEQVTAALRIAPVPAAGTSINFAGQFDRPFLLDTSGAAVARELGELTNVTTIFAAVREANRRRNSLAGTLRTRQGDLAGLRTAAQGFATLPARLAACERAEAALATAQGTVARIARLRAACDTLAVAEGVLARSAALPTVPDDAPLLVAHARLAGYRTLVRTWVTTSNAASAAGAAADQGAATEAALHTELHHTLVAAGTCPTCQRPMPSA